MKIREGNEFLRELARIKPANSRRISGRRFSPSENSICEPERQNDFRDIKPFCFDVSQSDQRIEYRSSDSSRSLALKGLGFRRVTKYALELSRT